MKSLEKWCPKGELTLSSYFFNSELNKRKKGRLNEEKKKKKDADKLAMQAE